MVTKEIEETVERTDYETVTEEVVWCDGCMDECTDSHVTLTNISTDCVEKMIDQSTMPAGVAAIDTDVVERVIDNAEQFHFCEGCQTGIREHGRTISTELFEADEEPDTSQSERSDDAPHPTLRKVAYYLAWFFAIGIVAQTTYSGALAMLILAAGCYIISKVTINDPSGKRVW